MINKNGKSSKERRKHPRFKVVSNLIEPIALRYAPEPVKGKGKGKKTAKDRKKKDAFAGVPKAARTQPAILTSLSAGGLSLITFLAPPHAKTYKMTLTIPGLDRFPIEGKVVRVHQKGETYVVGIEFTKIAKKYQRRITQMANDDVDCNIRISLGLPEACAPDCTFHHLCTKTQKFPHWKKRG